MKKAILKITLATFTFVCFGFVGANAQQSHKLGYIDFQELMQQMPEYKKANTDMEAYGKQLEDELKKMSAELEKKADDYQKQEPKMADAIKEMKQKELRDMQTRIQGFQQSAQQDVRKKEEELLKPIIEKAKKTISEVAKENSYYYVYDSSPGSPLLYKPESEDLMSLVKKKLSISETTSTPAAIPAAKPATPKSKN
jgi:outer membrane protein